MPPSSSTSTDHQPHASVATGTRLSDAQLAEARAHHRRTLGDALPTIEGQARLRGAR